MSNDINLTGKIFGDMEVIEYVRTSSNYMKIYKVKCNVCGKIKEIEYGVLNSLKTCTHTNKMCGIYIPSYDKNIGITIGDHTIEKLSYKNNGVNMYTARCNVCGHSFETNISNFK